MFGLFSHMVKRRDERIVRLVVNHTRHTLSITVAVSRRAVNYIDIRGLATAPVTLSVCSMSRSFKCGYYCYQAIK